MDARASAKYLRGSPQKARLVIDMIRGKNVNQALAILRYTNKRAALGIEKCVKSAIANANEAAEKANIAVDPDELWLKAAYVDRGPTKNRRRMRPAPQGRAYREQRHYCHITIQVTSDEAPKTEKELRAEAAKAKKEAAAPKAEKKKAALKAKKETKKAKVEEVETPAVEAEESAEAKPTETEAVEPKAAESKTAEKKEKTKPAD